MVYHFNHALAQTNIQTGAFEWETQIEIQPHPIKLSYNSRRNFLGLFGLGWCSSLDVDKIGTSYYYCGEIVTTMTPDQYSKIERLKNRWSKSKALITEIGAYRIEYQNHHLVEIHERELKTPKWSFQYDENKNLTNIRSSKNDTEEIGYDGARDRVVQHSDGQCVSNFVYRMTAKNRKSLEHRNCGQGQYLAQYFEQMFQRSSKGKVYLKEIRIKTPERSTRIQYSEAGDILHFSLDTRKEPT